MGRRRRPKRKSPPRWAPLTIAQILEWADAFHERHGRWPNVVAGNLGLPKGRRWPVIDTNLQMGQRGLPKGGSLAKLLAEQRGVRNVQGLPRLTENDVLAWADAHRARTGDWPQVRSGPIVDSPMKGDTWFQMDQALAKGLRGLPGGTSLAKLLARERGARTIAPALTEVEILKWAEAFHAARGRWPIADSGSDGLPADESWQAIDSALRDGFRGLAGGSSLARLLASHHTVRNRRALQRLTEDQILEWAWAYRRRAGTWPNKRSGPIPESPTPGEQWKHIDAALWCGYRGLAGGSSLTRLLASHHTVRNRYALQQLTEAQIVEWAWAFRRRAGAWPNKRSGPIPESPTRGDEWKHIDTALRHGRRGLPGKVTLRGLLRRLAPPPAAVHCSESADGHVTTYLDRQVPSAEPMHA